MAPDDIDDKPEPCTLGKMTSELALAAFNRALATDPADSASFSVYVGQFLALTGIFAGLKSTGSDDYTLDT